MSKAKPFNISKRVVFEAYRRVKANKGAAGVDKESIADFEMDLKNNLYKIWNRMSSGSYFPPPVRAVEIGKKEGGQRRLGVPTVSDRIAQMVAKICFEPEVEPYFHPDSYGYRPNKSAHDAIGVARQRCWRYNWVLDLDIKGFFDNISHNLLMRAVRKHTQCKWIKAAIENRLAECHLELHPEKTKTVYCMDQNRRGQYPNKKFDFLGYTFRARTAVSYDGRFFVSFLPAVSDKAAKSMRAEIRSWRIHRNSDKSLRHLAAIVNPKLQGWIN